MSKTLSPAAVGGFVLGALALGVVTLLVTGGSRLFETRQRLVFYFDSPLAGLDIGAPVEYRGVRVGTVTDVAIEYDDHSAAVRMPVRAELDPSRIRVEGGQPDDPQMTRMQEKIRGGLRATLALQSFVTGKTKVALDVHLNLPPAQPVFEDGALVIPTIAGPWERIARELESVPFADIAMDARRSVQRLADLLDSPALAGIVSNMNQLTRSAAAVAGRLEKMPLEETVGGLRKSADETLLAIRRASERLDKSLAEAKVGESSESLRKTLEELRQPLANLETGLAEGRQLMRETRDQIGPIREETVALLRELTLASRSLRELLTRLEETPEMLIRGKPQKEQP
jgi:paraquat-inducible protein B